MYASPMFRIVILFAALLQPQARPTKVYDAPINDAYRIRVEESHVMKSPNVCCLSSVRILLVDRTNANRFWEIAAIQEAYEYRYAVQRADNASVVIERTDFDYGIHYGSLKLFFDAPSKRLLKKIEFNPLEAMKSIATDDVRRLGLDPVIWDKIRNLNPDDAEVALPDALKEHPLPQSSYAEFARARPKRVLDGYDKKGTEIRESIAAYQVMNGRIWFGKSFYDGEGITGVGSLGYFDAAQNKFTMIRIPEVVDWSVSAILVEGPTLWAALQRHPEGEDQSGGLLRYDMGTSKTRIYRVDDLILGIYRHGADLVIATINGIEILHEDRIIRYRAEPAIDGKFAFF